MPHHPLARWLAPALLVPIVAVAATVLTSDIRSYRQAHSAEQLVDAGGRVVRLATLASVERGPSNAAMGADQPLPEARAAALSSARDKTDRALVAAEDAVGRILPALELTALADQFDEMPQQLARGRAEIDLLLTRRLADRAGADIEAAVQTMFAVQDPLQFVANGIERHLYATSLASSTRFSLAYFATVLREQGGRLGSILTTALAKHRLLTAEEHARFNRMIGQIERLRQDMQVFRALSGTTDRHIALFDAIERVYFGEGLAFATQIADARPEDLASLPDPAAFADRYVPTMKAIVDFRDYSLERAEEAAAQATALHAADLKAHAVIFVGVMLLWLVTAHLLRTRMRIEAEKNDLRLSAEEHRASALSDPLTGLANRRHYFETLRALAETPEAKPFAVAVIDLDGFKGINDLYGHPAGDRVLQVTADRLREMVSSTMTAARLGGDEFALIIRDDLSHASLTAFAEQLLARLGQPIDIGPLTRVRTEGSCGIALFPECSGEAMIVFERADHAMYRAKQSGRGIVRLFTAEDERALEATTRIEQALVDADLQSELEVYYQPIVASGTGRVVSLEALSRWNSPTLGSVPPGQFIPLAERHNMINTITLIVLEQVMALSPQLPAGLTLAINLSAANLADDVFMVKFVERLLKGNLPHGRLMVEITETSLIKNSLQAQERVQHLRQLGVKIALDDFGTGYSSLDYLHRLTVDRVKVDRSFIANLSQNPVSEKILTTVLALCRHLRIDCVVEGVETAEQLSVLAGLGCQLVQGFYFFRPMSRDAVLKLMSDAHDNARNESPRATAFARHASVA